MSITLGNIVSAGVAALALVVFIDMLRRGKLRERHALWWLGAGLLGLVVTLFPGLLEGAARALGGADPWNLEAPDKADWFPNGGRWICHHGVAISACASRHVSRSACCAHSTPMEVAAHLESLHLKRHVFQTRLSNQ